MMTIQYLEEYCISGKDYSEDAFFMDTNYLIAFIDSSHPYHLSTVIHTIYLLQQKARLYISETVLSEAVDVLAWGI
jgi:predicted nucleic acid-binding protein